MEGLHPKLRAALDKVLKLPPEQAESILRQALEMLQKGDDLAGLEGERRFVASGGICERDDIVAKALGQRGQFEPG
jgi:hypothetical protein